LAAGALYAANGLNTQKRGNINAWKPTRRSRTGTGDTILSLEQHLTMGNAGLQLSIQQVASQPTGRILIYQRQAKTAVFN
jgi:hypothetical protein